MDTQLVPVKVAKDRSVEAAKGMRNFFRDRGPVLGQVMDVRWSINITVDTNHQVQPVSPVVDYQTLI